MKTFLSLFGICLLMVSCSPKQDVIVTDIHGYKYRLVEREKKLSNNTVQVELWERIDPLETNYWYTPSLGSKMDTNNPPIFNSLMR